MEVVKFNEDTIIEGTENCIKCVSSNNCSLFDMMINKATEAHKLYLHDPSRVREIISIVMANECNHYIAINTIKKD